MNDMDSCKLATISLKPLEWALALIPALSLQVIKHQSYRMPEVSID